MAELAERIKVKQVDLAEAFVLAKEIHRKKMGKRLANASTSHLDEFGVVKYTNDGNVCHNHMNNNGFKYVINGLQIGTSYTHTMGRPLSAEVELWFVDYIINRSPYSETFISKDAVECLQDQMTISSGDHPSNLMVAALVALRRLWEYTTVVSVAYSLAKQGVNEDLAFVLGHLAQVVEDPKPQDTLQWNACKSGHCSINPTIMDFKVLQNFLGHKVKKPNKLWSSGGGYSNAYEGYDCMYGQGADESINKYVQRCFPYNLYKDVQVKQSTNPFTAALPKAKDAGGESAPYDKAIAVMAEWAKTHLMERINNA